MNNTALFDYYYSRRSTASRAVTRDPAGFAHWENLPSLRESCRARRAMRALMSDSPATTPHAAARPFVR